MTRQGWAERKVVRKLGGQYISLSPKLTAELLLAEHRRAVRVVKKHFPDSWLHPYLTGPTAILPRDGAITPKHVERLLTRIQADILAALKKGRT